MLSVCSFYFLVKLAEARELSRGSDVFSLLHWSRNDKNAIWGDS